MNDKNKLCQFYTCCFNVPDIHNFSVKETSHKKQAVYFGNACNYKNRKDFCTSLLSEFEIERMKRFVFDDDRLTYCISHGFMRISLSEITKMPNGDLKIEYPGNTKPHLINANIDFSLSHSDNYFACVVANNKGSNIGVDIEKINNLKDFKAIIRDYMHDDEIAYILDNLLSDDEQQLRFYEIWTRKEAFLKMLGSGIVINLPDINVVPGERTITAEFPQNINIINTETFIYTKTTSNFVLSVSANFNYNPDFTEINL